ncbi:HutD family protein [Lutibacter sp.]|uniref:HutD/Ves family protein n=1 Tax=Lutibacter sp. TaxID=1925666 RepID=UPI00273477C5|nr:HutD family protein [Lutibacter sp.]MDP3313793.1 HutD family protein [Lutibacter sp.]
MELKIIPSENYKINKWSGGTTKQLFIYPQTSDYKSQNFDFRLSTATVETEISEFTLLPKISRKLMVLEGEIVINHENKYSKQLNKFDVDTFEGDWKTTSIGTCTDFNLMTTKNTTGELSSVIINKKQKLDFQLESNWEWYFVYVFKGKVRILINKDLQIIKEGDVLVIEKPLNLFLQILSIENCELVVVKIL